MSLLSNNWVSNRRVQARLGARSFSAELWRRWPRAALLQRRATWLEGAGPAAAVAPELLASTLVELAPAGAVAGASLHVELADARVHFDIAQGRFAGRSARQLRSFAQSCAAELLGDAAADHELRWQLQRDERHLLVCAVPRRQLETLAAAAASARLQLASVQPAFAVAWNRHARALTARSAVFAVASGTQTVATFVQRGVMTAISHGPGCRATPVANAAACPFDAHVDSLLASLGVDAGGTGSQAPAFVIVGPRQLGAGLAPRWTVLPTRTSAARTLGAPS